jgi:diguanylate cyclase
MTDERLMGAAGVALGHRTLGELGGMGVTPRPPNYQVWLAYNLRSHPELRRAVQGALSEGRQLTEADLNGFYERFFCSTELSSRVMETGSRIAHEIADALDALKLTGQTAEHYDATLKAIEKKLSLPSVDEAALKNLIAALAGATREMAASNATLATQLAASASQMDNMRASLRNARAQALTDPLTGIANRKLFDETLQLRAEEADTNGSPLALALCDIDHFKSFNDKWGHQTGDQVIRFVASELAKHARADHLVARYGGEEFAVIMPRTTVQEAARLAEEMRLAIEGKRLVRRSTKEQVGCVTASFGVAAYARGESVSRLVARADEQLYTSKRTGRNRVTADRARTVSAPLA